MIGNDFVSNTSALRLNMETEDGITKSDGETYEVSCDQAS